MNEIKTKQLVDRAVQHLETRIFNLAERVRILEESAGIPIRSEVADPVHSDAALPFGAGPAPTAGPSLEPSPPPTNEADLLLADEKELLP